MDEQVFGIPEEHGIGCHVTNLEIHTSTHTQLLKRLTPSTIVIKKHAQNQYALHRFTTHVKFRPRRRIASHQLVAANNLLRSSLDIMEELNIEHTVNNEAWQLSEWLGNDTIPRGTANRNNRDAAQSRSFHSS